MSSHLSQDQISRCFIGGSSTNEEQHLESCVQCRAKLEQWTRICSLFREAMKDVADRRIASRTLPLVATQLQRNHFAARRWQWALVSAVVVLLSLIPIYKNEEFQHSHLESDQTGSRSIEFASAPEARDDVLLMEAVTAHLTRPMPAPMEAVMALLPRGEGSNNARGDRQKSKPPERE
jgi:anti-sigma factor RsiW